MNENVYSPPEADLTPDASADEPRFYVVATGKAVFLYLITMGFYALYWFYAHWQAYRKSTGENLWPIPRAIFAIFFTHSLFARIDHAVKDRQPEFTWPAMPLATIFVLLSLASSVLGRLTWREIGSPTTDVLSLVIMIPLVMILARAQTAANVSAGDPDGKTNCNFTLANFFWTLLGAVVWLLAIVGLLDIFGVIDLGP